MGTDVNINIDTAAIQPELHQKIQLLINDSSVKWDKSNLKPLMDGCTKDKHIALRLRYISRTQGLPIEISKLILVKLSVSSNSNFDINIILAQTLKYALAFNRDFIKPSSIWKLVENCKLDAAFPNEQDVDADYKSELIVALCNSNLTKEWLQKLKHTRNGLNKKALACIDTLLNEAFVKAQIAGQGSHIPNAGLPSTISKDKGNYIVNHQNALKSSLKRQPIKSNIQANAVKAQQISTETCQEFNSEKEQLNQLNLFEALNSRAKSISATSTKDIIPLTNENESTSFQAWYRTTYYEVENLKDLSNNKALSTTDQNYLYSTLFGTQICFAYRSTVNEMIGIAFYNISGKQKLQQKHCNGLLNLLLSTSDEYKSTAFKKNILQTVQKCFARDESYFTTENESILINFQAQCISEELQLLVFEILTALNNGNNNYEEIFRMALESLFDSIRQQSSLRNKLIRYINLQSLNKQRAEKLFTKKVTEDFVGIIYNTNNKYDSELRNQIAEILENYLQHEIAATNNNNIGLDLKNLKILMQTAMVEIDLNLKTALLRIILRGIDNLDKSVLEKEQSGNSSLLESLVNFYLAEPNLLLSHIVLIGIQNIIHRGLGIANIFKLGPKLLDNTEISESDLRFDKDEEITEKENDAKVSVSSIAAEIMLANKAGLEMAAEEQQQQDKNSIQQALSYIIQAIECSEDKQTRILCSELIYHISSAGIIIPSEYLVKLKDFINDPVPDIKIHCTLCLSKGSFKLSTAIGHNTHINANLLELLTEIYAYEPIIFNNEEYSKEINTNVINTFESEAIKPQSEFEDKVFNFFAKLISSNEIDQNILIQVLNTLKQITANQTGNRILVFALERLICNSTVEIRTTVNRILENLILRGQIVSDFILVPIFNQLLISTVAESNNNSNDVMPYIISSNNNQDISDELFTMLTMEINCRKLDGIKLKNEAISELSKLYCDLNNGKKLTAYGFSVFENKFIRRKLQVELVIKCLIKVAENKQSIPLQILNLIVSFGVSKVFLQLCIALIANNQGVTPEMKCLVMDSFEKEQIAQNLNELVSIIISLGKLDLYNFKLTGSVVKNLAKICIENGENSNVFDILQLLRSMSTRFNDPESQRAVCDVFLHCLAVKTNAKQFQMALDGIYGISTINSQLLTDNQINCLVELLSTTKLPNAVKTLNSILLLHSSKLSLQQSTILSIIDAVHTEDHSEFVKAINHYTKVGTSHFMSQDLKYLCYERFGKILLENTLEVDKIYALLLLQKVMSNEEILPIALQGTLVNLVISSNNKNQQSVQEISLAILMNQAKLQAIFPQNLVPILESNFDASHQILTFIEGKSGLTAETKLHLNIEKLRNINDSQEIENILLIIVNILDSEKYVLISTKANKILFNTLRLNTASKYWIQIVQHLIKAKQITNTLEVDANDEDVILAEMICKRMENMSSSENFKEMLSLLQFIMAKEFSTLINKDTMQQYEKLLVEVISKGNAEGSVENQYAAFKIIAEYAEQVQQMQILLPETIAMFISNLQNESALIRQMSFKVLRKYCIFNDDNDNGKEFQEFIEQLIDTVNSVDSWTKQNTGYFISNEGVQNLTEFEFDLLETLLSTETWNFKSLTKLNQTEWIYELWLSDFITKAVPNNSLSAKMTSLEKLDKLFHKFETKNRVKLLQCLSSKINALGHSENHLNLVLDSLNWLTLNEIKFFMKNEAFDLNSLHLAAICKIIKTKLCEAEYINSSEIELFAINLLKCSEIEVPLKIAENVSWTSGTLAEMKQLIKVYEQSNIDALFSLKDVPNNFQYEVNQLKIFLSQQILQNKLLVYNLCYQTKQDNERIINLLQLLLSNGQKVQDLLELLNNTNEATVEKSKTSHNVPATLETILRFLLNYKLDQQSTCDILMNLKNAKFDNWIQVTNKFGIHYLQKYGYGLKSIDDILVEAKEYLKPLQDLLDRIEIKQLPNRIQLVHSGEFYSKFHSKLGNNGIIGSWNQCEITAWANYANKCFRKCKIQIDLEFSIEALAVTKRAYYLVTKFHLTTIQIISVLLALNKGLNGQLQQVPTGSGKSTIVAVLAVINALKVGTVDIFTSSPVLAERDARSWSNFYSLFGLTTNHNSDPPGIYTKGLKQCYKCSIVYGETSMFQFDYLREYYSNLGTMGKRQLRCAIVDEVDTTLIDDLTKLARLSSLIPGMDLLQIIYHMTFNRIQFLESKFFTIGENIFYIEGKITFDEKTKLPCLEFCPDETGEIYKIPNLVTFILQDENLSSCGIHRINDIQEFVRNHLVEFLNGLLGVGVDGKEQAGQIKVPNNLKQFVQNQILHWVDSCITAFSYEENIHYIVHDGQIKPVDFSTTGIVQDSTAWSNGLHQFIQIKHGLKVTSETITTNFISNIALFQKYQRKFKLPLNSERNNDFGNSLSKADEIEERLHNLFKADKIEERLLALLKGRLEFTECNIIGFTGTLGSTHTKTVMNKLYNVNCIEMPSTHFKLYAQYPDLIAFNYAEWLQQIIQAIQFETRRNRGVLIICETIKDAQELANVISSLHINYRLYIKNNANQEDNIERIQSGQVFIATNLAGRGTDIKTDEIEQFGGLHVLLTFLPGNIRVEEQAFGRTSRQGKLGSGQLICINTSSIKTTNAKELRELRDYSQGSELESFLQNELPLVKAKDRCFRGYCNFLNKLREKFRDKDDLVKKAAGMFVPYLRTASEDELITLQAVEERWAMFVKEIDDRRIEPSQAWLYYKCLELRLSLDFNKEKLIKAPFYHIRIGNHFLLSKYFERAEEQYKKAIELDPDFSTAAYVGLGYLYLKRTSAKYTNYKTNSIQILEKVLPLIQNEIANIISMQTLYKNRGGSFDTTLFQQLTSKQDALNSFFNCIQSAIEITKRSLRQVDIIVMVDDTDSNEEIELPYGGLDLTLDFMDDIATACKNRINEIPDDQQTKFGLKFKNLTCREDTKTKDQAKDTIEGSQNAGKVELHCESTNIELLMSMLYKDRHVFNIHRQGAICCIESWQNERSMKDKLWSKLKDNTKIDVNRITDRTEEGQLSEQQLQQKLLLKEGTFDKVKNVLEQLSDDDFVNLTYRNANEKIAKSFKGSSCIMDLEFQNLMPESCLKLLKSFPNFSVQIAMNIRNNKKMLDSISPHLGSLKGQEYINVKLTCPNAKALFSRILTLAELLQRQQDKLEELLPTYQENGPGQLTFLEVESAVAYQLIQGLTEKPNTSTVSSINLKIIDFHQVQFNPIELNQISSYLAKSKLVLRDIKDVAALIPILRELSTEVVLLINGLTKEEALITLQNANIIQEDVEETKLKMLSELFCAEFMPTIELWEFSLRGILILCEFNEKRFIPWLSIGCLVGIAAVQMGIGVLLIGTGFGATYGMSFITEGVVDLFTAYRAYRNRQFSWSDYATQKAISLTISALSMGLSSFKDAGKGIQAAAEGAGKEVAESGLVEVITKGSTYVDKIIKHGTNLKEVGLAQVGVAFTEAAAREGLNTIMNIGSQFAMDQLEPTVKQNVEKRIIENFSNNSNLHKLLGLYWSLDKLSNKKQLDVKLKRIVSDTINPNNKLFTKYWSSVGSQLIQGTLSSSQNYGSTFSWVFRIAGMLNGIYELNFAIKSTVDEILNKLVQDKPNVTNILVHYCNVNIFEAQIMANYIEELVDKAGDNFVYKVAAAGKDQLKNKNVTKYFESLTETQTKFQLKDISMVIAHISKMLTDYLLKVTDSQLRTPVTTFLVSKTVANLSAIVQSNYIINPEHNTEELKGKKVIIVADQIRANAKEYTIAFELLSIQKDIDKIQAGGDLSNNNGQNSRQTGKISEGVSKMVLRTLNGAPADIATISLLAKQLNLDVVIVDNSSQVTEDDVKSAKQIIRYHEGKINLETKENLPGHFELIDKETGNPVHIPSTSDDCGYAVLAQMAELGTDGVQELRVQAAKLILAHSDTFERVVQHEEWIRSHYPEAANNYLLVGGRQPRRNVDENVGPQPILNVKKKVQIAEGVELPEKVRTRIPIGCAGTNRKILVLQREMRALREALGMSHVRFHLVSARAGGDRTTDNLTLASHDMNVEYFNRLEKHYLQLMEDYADERRAEFVFKVNIDYQSTDDGLKHAKAIHVSIGLQGDSPKINEMKEALSYRLQGFAQKVKSTSGRVDHQLTFVEKEGIEVKSTQQETEHDEFSSSTTASY